MAGPFKMKGSPMQRNFGIGSPARKTYKEAYETRDKSHKNYATISEADYIKEAKAWNTKKYGTTEPTRDAKKANISKADLAKQHTTTKDKVRAATAKAKQDAEVDKSTKAAKASNVKGKKIVKEEVASISKKDLRREKRAKTSAKKQEYKAAKKQVKSLSKADRKELGVTRKDIRKAKREDIKATRKEYKAAKKTLKTLNK